MVVILERGVRDNETIFSMASTPGVYCRCDN